MSSQKGNLSSLINGEGDTQPTWFALVMALKSETVKHPQLAEEQVKK